MKTLTTHCKDISLLMYYHWLRVWNVYVITAVLLLAVPIINMYVVDFGFTMIDFQIAFLTKTFGVIVFLAVFLFWLGYSFFEIVKRRWKYDTSDRFYTLPISRIDIFISDILFMLVILYSIYILQSLTYFLCYQIYTNLCPETMKPNGFFFALLNGYYTQLFFPLQAKQMIVLLFNSIVLCIAIVYFATFGFRKNKVAILLFMLAIVLGIGSVFVYIFCTQGYMMQMTVQNVIAVCYEALINWNLMLPMLAWSLFLGILAFRRIKKNRI